MRTRTVEKRLLTLAVSLFVLGVGCNTIAIMPRDPIDVPRGLTDRQVELVILQSALGLRLATGDERRMAEEEGFVEPTYIQFRNSDWQLEDNRPGVILASVSPRTHYLRVAIRYDSNRVRVEIDGAENMKYDGSFIHGKAIRWIGNLEESIRSGLSLAAHSIRPAPMSGVSS